METPDLPRWISPGLPSREALPQWVTPLPAALENVAFRYVWVIVAINLVGTAFGFWYYTAQLSRTPMEMWIFVPDSPVATLLIALALAAWALGRANDYLTAMAFIGNIKLGLWTPYSLVIYADAFLEFTPTPMYAFLIVSHLGMVIQAFVLHRITDFPVKAIGIATVWYTVDLLMDYFIPLVGTPTYTSVPYQDTAPFFTTSVLQVTAAGAVVLTLVPLFWMFATRVTKLRRSLV